MSVANYSKVTVMSEPEIIATVKVDRSGRITVPSEVRKSYNIKFGDKIHWVQIGNDFFIKPTRFRTPIKTEHSVGSLVP